MRKKLLVLMFLAFTTQYNLSWAYHGDVHYQINENAVKASQFDSVLKNQLSIKNGIEAKFKKNSKEEKVWQWIAYGGEAEDYGKLGKWHITTSRAFNHFHDPLEVWDEARFKNPYNIFY